VCEEPVARVARRSRPLWRAPHEAVILLCSGRTFRPAAPVALLVGTVLSAVNEGSVIINGQVGTATAIRIGVNYIVPYLVASTGYLMACRTPPDGTRDDAHC